MIKGKDLEELKVPKVAEIRKRLYEALGKAYAAGKKDCELKPLVAKLAASRRRFWRRKIFLKKLVKTF